MSKFRIHESSGDRSANDRSRHKKKIEKAIKEGVHNIVAEESIIGKDGKKKIKIPVRGIKEYQFIYGDNGSGQGNKQVGSAKDVKKGQIIQKKNIVIGKSELDITKEVLDIFNSEVKSVSN